ncbi:MAG: ATP-binding protein [Calditrichae bacterium]|nr:ATP-binding protein [Calditrichota bacterium]MCB9057526.1 ATP-binding protein [Calditrichia bacterium]
MNELLKYMDFCQTASSLDNICYKTFEFIKDIDNNKDIKLIQHSPEQFLPVILKQTGEIDENELPEYLKELNISESLSAHDQKYQYFFSAAKFRTEKIMFFMVEKPVNHSIDLILQCWQKNYSLINSVNNKIRQNNCNEFGNLISQLLHDVNSLTELSKDAASAEAKDRYNYQKKVNKNLLFYLRDFDLFKSEIEVEKLVKDSLSLLDLRELPRIDFDGNITNITLDVELFSTSFNEIVKNAIRATEGDMSKISLSVLKEKPLSPFIHENWIIFKITDLGKGINGDFLPYIKNPFFTTYKYAGHSGFGLANADKIIKAHGGFLNTDSRKNRTTISIYLPEK